MALLSLNLFPAPAHLTLAQRHYKDRVLELRNQILVEEAKLKCASVTAVLFSISWTTRRSLVTEIDEIRSGLWDDRILAQLEENTQSPAIEDKHTAIAASESLQEHRDVESSLAEDAPMDKQNESLQLEVRRSIQLVTSSRPTIPLYRQQLLNRALWNNFPLRALRRS